MSQLKDYLNNSSPISRLQQGNKFPLSQLHNSIDLKLNLLKQNPKNYDRSRTKAVVSGSNQLTSSIQQFSQMKASSIIYNIPQITPPQINFEISDHLRQKINEIKEDIVTKLPAIKSSQYSSNKVQSFLSRRTVLKDLQIWLQQKLKCPPLTQQDSIQYKNMIMGVGMKEVIRLIGIRCTEQANIVNEIWELTWSICRQIILYLSKRAHKCQKILEEEASFFRASCENKIKKCQQEVVGIKQQNVELKYRSGKLASDISLLKKKNKELKLFKLNLEANFSQLTEQFQSTFKQNLILHLKMAPNDNARRQWVKRKYILFVHSKRRNNALFKKFIQNFLKQNNISFDTEELSEVDLIVDINKFKDQERKRNHEIEQQLFEKFKPINRQVQTDGPQTQNKYVQTMKIKLCETALSTQPLQSHQMGVNTETTNQSKNNLKKQKNDKLKGLKKQTVKQKAKHKSQNIDQLLQNTSLLSQQQQKSPASNTNISITQNKSTFLINEQKPNLETVQQNRQSVDEYENRRSTYYLSNQNKSRTFIVDKSDKKISDQVKKMFSSSRNLHYKNVGEIMGGGREKQRSVRDVQQILKAESKRKIKFVQLEDQVEENILQNMENFQVPEGQIQKSDMIKSLKTQFSIQKKRINDLQKIIRNKLELNEQRISISNFGSSNQTDKMGNMSLHDMQILEMVRNGKIDSLIKIIKQKSHHLAHTEEDQSQQCKNQSMTKTLSSRLISGKKPLNYSYNKKIQNSYEESKKKSQGVIFGLDEDDQIIGKGTSKKNIMESNGKGVHKSGMSRLGACSRFDNKLKIQGDIRNFGEFNFIEVCARYYVSELDGESIKQSGQNEQQKKLLLKQQYREVYRQVSEQKSMQKNEKHMRTIIQRSMNTLFKQLCRQITNAQKQGIQRMQQLKATYSTLPIILTNRYNMNFGVRKLASKHIKDLLVSLKAIKKYTEKYALISYFFINPSLMRVNGFMDRRNSELMFFYVLLASMRESVFSERQVTIEETETIAQLAQTYLTRDQRLINVIRHGLEVENNSNFMNFCKSIVSKYEQLYDERTAQMEFIFKALCIKNKQGKQGILFTDFVQFLSPLYIKKSIKSDRYQWQSDILHTLIQLQKQQKHQEGLIQKQTFDRLVFKCPQFCHQQLSQYLSQNITLSEEQKNLQQKQTQSKYLQLCSQNALLSKLLGYVFESESIKEEEIQFWLKFVKLYVLDIHVEEVVGGLMVGVIEPRSSVFLLGCKAYTNDF